MKKPKTKLQEAKERFIKEYQLRAGMMGYWGKKPRAKIRRQLNNLIKLAREEGRKQK